MNTDHHNEHIDHHNDHNEHQSLFVTKVVPSLSAHFIGALLCLWILEFVVLKGFRYRESPKWVPSVHLPELYGAEQ